MPISRRRAGKTGAVADTPPPVSYASDLAPWRLPQFVSPFPQRQPGIAYPGGSPLIGQAGAVDPMPVAPPQTGILDPHHYADPTGNAIPVPTATAGTTPFLTSPSGKRNWLTLRNPAAAGTIFVDFGQCASANSPIAIAPGQTILFDTVVPQSDLYCFSTTAALTLAFSYSNLPPVVA